MDLAAGGESPGRGWIVLRRYETTQDVTAPERIAEPDRDREADLLSFLLSLDVRPVRMNLAVLKEKAQMHAVEIDVGCGHPSDPNPVDWASIGEDANAKLHEPR